MARRRWLRLVETREHLCADLAGAHSDLDELAGALHQVTVQRDVARAQVAELSIENEALAGRVAALVAERDRLRG